MYEEHTAKLDEGELKLTAVLAPDTERQTPVFCRDLRSLDVKRSHVKVSLDVAKATVHVELTIPPQRKKAKPTTFVLPAFTENTGVEELEPGPPVQGRVSVKSFGTPSTKRKQ